MKKMFPKIKNDPRLWLALLCVLSLAAGAAWGFWRASAKAPEPLGVLPPVAVAAMDPEAEAQESEQEVTILPQMQTALLISAEVPPAGQSVGVVIVIDKTNYVLVVLRDGEPVKKFGVAVGKNRGNKRKAGDMRTPEGAFVVERIQDASAWTHDFGDGKGVIAGAYGPLFIRLKTPPWKGIGIHGTHDPDSIGHDVTEGCIRLRNQDVLALRKWVRVGTPVVINP